VFGFSRFLHGPDPFQALFYLGFRMPLPLIAQGEIPAGVPAEAKPREAP
jgi:hypothetical protein